MPTRITRAACRRSCWRIDAGNTNALREDTLGGLLVLWRRIFYLTAVVCPVFTFVLGRWSAPTAPLEIRRSPYEGWILVYRHGKLSSEWHETKDAELWRWLDMLLREHPELYRSPEGEPPRGRRPVLQQARL